MEKDEESLGKIKEHEEAGNIAELENMQAEASATFDYGSLEGITAALARLKEKAEQVETTSASLENRIGEDHIEEAENRTENVDARIENVLPDAEREINAIKTGEGQEPTIVPAEKATLEKAEKTPEQIEYENAKKEYDEELKDYQEYYRQFNELGALVEKIKLEKGYTADLKKVAQEMNTDWQKIDIAMFRDKPTGLTNLNKIKAALQAEGNLDRVQMLEESISKFNNLPDADIKLMNEQFVPFNVRRYAHHFQGKFGEITNDEAVGRAESKYKSDTERKVKLDEKIALDTDLAEKVTKYNELGKGIDSRWKKFNVVERRYETAKKKVEGVKIESAEQNPEKQKKQEALNKMFAQIEDAKNKKEEEQKSRTTLRVSDELFKTIGKWDVAFSEIESLPKEAKTKLLDSLVKNPSFFSTAHSELLSQLTKDQLGQLSKNQQFVVDVDPASFRNALSKAEFDFSEKSSFYNASDIRENFKTRVDELKAVYPQDPNFAKSMFAIKTAETIAMNDSSTGKMSVKVAGQYLNEMAPGLPTKAGITEFKNTLFDIIENKGLLGLARTVQINPDGSSLAKIMKGEAFQNLVLGDRSLFEALKNSKKGIKAYIGTEDEYQTKNVLNAYSEMKRAGLLTEGQVKELITL